MAIYYVDLVSGSDAAAGTNVAPLLTVNAAVAKASGPHDIRVAKTSSSVSVSSTFTWTANSVTVNTSSDVTASIAVGDYIGKPTAAGNGAEEAFYRVNATTSNTLTLELKYSGSTGATSSCKKLFIATTGASGANAMTIAAGTNLSGGWNLSSTPTQDGETWFKPNASRTVGVYAITGSTGSVSKMNIAESGYPIYLTSTATVTDCSVFAYNLAVQLTSTGIINNCCCSCVVTYSGIYGGGTISNCVVFGITGIANLTAVTSISNVKFYCGTTGLVGVSGMPPVTNCTFKYLTTGVSSAGTNMLFDNCAFDSCSTGLSSNTVVSGLVLKNCSFTNCSTYGVFLQQIHGVVIDSCSFSSCAKGVSLDAYAGDIYLNNCSFTSPTTYGIDRTGTSGTVYCYGCSIDGGSLAKAYSRPISGYALKMYVFQNSFGQTGTIWGVGSVTKDIATYRTTAPSCGISWVSTTTMNNLDVKIVSCFAKASTQKIFSLWIKAANASWAGTLTPKWKLDGVTIKTESNITSLTASWVQYTWTCAGNLITADGELSLEFLPNMNSYAINVDDFTVS